MIGQKSKGFRLNTLYGLRTMTLCMGWLEIVCLSQHMRHVGELTISKSINANVASKPNQVKKGMVTYTNLNSVYSKWSHMFTINSTMGYLHNSKIRLHSFETILAINGYITNGLQLIGSELNQYKIMGMYISVQSEVDFMEIAQLKFIIDRLLLNHQKRYSITNSYSLLNLKLVPMLNNTAKVNSRYSSLCLISPIVKLLPYTTLDMSPITSLKQCSNLTLAIVVLISGFIPVTTILTKILATQLEQTIDHLELLSKFSKMLTYYYTGLQKKSFEGGLFGYRILIKGTLNGSRRSQTYIMQQGKICMGTKQAFLDEFEATSKTSVGTLGISSLYCYSRG